MIAGIAGAALIVFLFLPWYSNGESFSGWEGQTTTDVYLLITGLVAIVAALTAGGAMNLPGVTMSGATALLGGVATILLLWLVIFDFPDGVDRGIGLFLALIAAAAIAYGGYTAAHED